MKEPFSANPHPVAPREHARERERDEERLRERERALRDRWMHAKEKLRYRAACGILYFWNSNSFTRFTTSLSFLDIPQIRILTCAALKIVPGSGYSLQGSRPVFAGVKDNREQDFLEGGNATTNTVKATY